MLHLVLGSSGLNVGAKAPRATVSMAETATTITPLPASVKPGVVTGEALWDLLEHAKENKYAIPAVNVVSSCSISSCLEAAKKYGGPMIIQFSRGGGQFICGKTADNTDDAACIAGTVAVRASPPAPGAGCTRMLRLATALRTHPSPRPLRTHATASWFDLIASHAPRGPPPRARSRPARSPSCTVSR